jgi:hypothetical protein
MAVYNGNSHVANPVHALPTAQIPLNSFKSVNNLLTDFLQ